MYRTITMKAVSSSNSTHFADCRKLLTHSNQTSDWL